MSPNSAIKASLIETLQQGERLLDSLTNETFTQSLPEAFNASIGGHYRHCLEHFEILKLVEETGVVDYDLRKRDRFVEGDCLLAKIRTLLLRRHFEQTFNENLFDKWVEVRCKVSFTRATSGEENGQWDRISRADRPRGWWHVDFR